jgi:hypothetical protein
VATARARVVVDRAGVESWLTARDDVVVESREPTATPAPPRAPGGGVEPDEPPAGEVVAFTAATGPVAGYRREVVVRPVGDERYEVTSVARFRVAVPYFGRLFVPALRRSLRRVPTTDGHQPWWAPPDRLDERAAGILGVLAAASLVAGYLGTVLTQTITYAADDFEVVGDRAQGTALATVRVGIALALVLVAVADRKGRRVVLLLAAAGGCVLAATGALAPSLPWLTVSQTGSRAFSTALALLIAIVAAEEMPRGSRAYAVSVLGMAGALGPAPACCCSRSPTWRRAPGACCTSRRSWPCRSSGASPGGCPRAVASARRTATSASPGTAAGSRCWPCRPSCCRCSRRRRRSSRTSSSGTSGASAPPASPPSPCSRTRRGGSAS